MPAMNPRRLLGLPLFVLALGACDDKPQAQKDQAMQTPVASSSATLDSGASTITPDLTPDPAAKGDIPAPPDVGAAPDDAEKTASGLATKVIEKGTGTEQPGPSDRVKVHYTGWTKDGKMFDSSVKRGEPITFPLNGVIKGWTEGLQLMVAGEKRRLWIPADLAYGNRPTRPGAPVGDLVFDVELIEVLAAPKAPDDRTPPATAKKTKSGLAYEQLEKGSGDTHPTADDAVTVHYSGWTKDGKMFDSSVVNGRPATFPLKNVIKGWTEGLQLMKKGDKFRFWIPADLAYGDKPSRPGAPVGDLIFDVELLEIRAKR